MHFFLNIIFISVFALKVLKELEPEYKARSAEKRQNYMLRIDFVETARFISL